MELIAESEMDVVSVIVNEDSSTLCYEGDVGKYGRVFGNHTLIPSDSSRNSGVFHGQARAIDDDGNMVAATLQGIWRRDGSKIKIHSLDDASNGDQNYATIEVDILAKKAKVAVHSLGS